MSNPIVVKISNVCSCMWCEECEMLQYETPDDKCPDCGEAMEYSKDGCFGDMCWTPVKEYIDELIAEWMKNNPSPTNSYLIDASGVGWRHLSGYKVIGADDVDVVEAIGPNTHWNQEWAIDTSEGGEVTCVQSHHDAMGELYNLRPLIALDVAELSMGGILSTVKWWAEHDGFEYKPEEFAKRATEFIEDNISELDIDDGTVYVTDDMFEYIKGEEA